MRQMLLPFAVTMFVCAAVTPAVAGEVTVTVSTEGLDFTRSADVAAMKDRIDVAVKRACTRPTAAARFGAEAIDECVSDGTTKALAALDAQLTRD